MMRRSLCSATLMIVAACAPTPSAVDPIDGPSGPDAGATDVAPGEGLDSATNPISDHVGLTPRDLTTAIGTTELAVWADDGLGATTSATLADLAAHAQLRTYPELADVPFTTSIHPPSDGQARAFVSIAPADALSNRWYVLSLSALPNGAIGSPNDAKPGLGALSSRFNPGSAPVRRRISLCDKASAERIVVEFSEGIALSSVGSLLVVGDDSCKYTPAGTAESQSQLYFDCGASLKGATSLRFVLKRGIVSMSGVPLGVLDDAATSNETLVDTSDRDEDLSFAGLVESSGCVDRMQ